MSLIFYYERCDKNRHLNIGRSSCLCGVACAAVQHHNTSAPPRSAAATSRPNRPPSYSLVFRLYSSPVASSSAKSSRSTARDPLSVASSSNACPNCMS